MSRTVTLKSLPRAFAMIREIEHQGYDWGEDYRRAGRAAVVDVLEGRLVEAVDRHIERISAGEVADRRNGSYRRWLMTELGDIELSVPRTRHYGPLVVDPHHGADRALRVVNGAR